MLYKLGSNLHMADWLSRQNHIEIKDKEIKGMELNINSINVMTDISSCMAIHDTQDAARKDIHVQKLQDNIIENL